MISFFLRPDCLVTSFRSFKGNVCEIAMGIPKSLPFKEGQLAEAKSFMDGFRGAWFRCKIMKISRRKNELQYAMEYYDYPDDATEWTKLYQKPSVSSKQKVVKKELMVRPKFPHICREDEMPDRNTISEVVVVVDNVWKVGDSVDWWKDNCYWSGKVIAIEGDDRVKIKLPDPPQGEGESYSVYCKDLRPSLDWSPESGWAVPLSREIHNGHSCPRLIQPVKQDNDEHNITAATLLELNESMSFHTSTMTMPLSKSSMQCTDLVKQNEDTSKKDIRQTQEVDVDLSVGDSAVEMPNCSGNVSSTYLRDIAAEIPGSPFAEEQYYAGESSKKIQVDKTISFNSVSRGSLESTIVDLEELVNRVKWLRRILKSEVPSNTLQPTWKFLEHPAGSPK